MVQKSPVNIEWYDDGYTIEEQNILKKNYLNSRPVLKISEQFKKSEQERIISELRQKLAANEEYILELEEDLKQATNSPEELVYKKKYDNIKSYKENLEHKLHELHSNPESEIGKLHETIRLMQKKIDMDKKEIIAPYLDKITKLEKQVHELKVTRDTLINNFYTK